MTARIQNINVLDLPADALVYSTNVLLNCTGGVGACLLKRYGQEVQSDLHALLRERGIKFAERGTVFQHVTKGMPYTKVFHTIPCNGFYDTTEEIVTDVLRKSLSECVLTGSIRTVAMSALATGYGHLAFDHFFRIASSILHEASFESLECVTICIDDNFAFNLVAEQIVKERLLLTKF